MKKLLLFLIIGIFLISFVTASISDLGTFKQGSCINIPQTCPDCTYNNISKITMDGESNTVLGEVVMQKDDTYYNYTFCNTTLVGEYTINGYGDEGGTKDTWEYKFKITPSGNSSNEVLYIVLILIIYGITFVGFFGKNEIITLLGSLAMIWLGIYLINEGIIIYRDWITNGIAYLTIGLAAYFGFMAGYSLYKDM